MIWGFTCHPELGSGSLMTQGQEIPKQFRADRSNDRVAEFPSEIKDITIIGAGPSGLFTAFQAGMYEASVRIIDSMPETGGQLTALYPEKYIFDAPGFTRITAKELAVNLFAQANQFAQELFLNETVLAIQAVQAGTELNSVPIHA